MDAITDVSVIPSEEGFKHLARVVLFIRMPDGRIFRFADRELLKFEDAHSRATAIKRALQEGRT